MSIPSELAERYREGRLIPFIGAGVSMSVTWTDSAGKDLRGPSWKELVDQAARQMDFQDPDLLRVRGTDLQILEYFEISNSGQFAKLTNWLVRLSPPDAALKNSAIHLELSLMDKCRTFYTTNFDDYIERSFDLNNRKCRSIAVEADMGHVEELDSCEIIKFHGDLNHPDKMVLSESDYEERLGFKTAMDYRLRSDVLGRVLLFIGYSFRDWNVSYLFRMVNSEFDDLPRSRNGRRAYIAVPDPSEFEVELFHRRNIEVIPISGKNPTDEIAQLLRDVRS